MESRARADEGAALLRLACGRVASGARAIADAHRFGVAEGPHQQPWTPEYHSEAVHMYGASLPASYQRDIAALFAQAARHLPALVPSEDVSPDALIIDAYMQNAASSILGWLNSHPATVAREPAEPVEMDDHTPTVIHFDQIASLTTLAGARRLEQAAVAVQLQTHEALPEVLNGEQRRLLAMLAAGVPIVEVGAELGLSRRSTYRAMSRLFSDLGVENRTQAVLQAGIRGLLDTPPPESPN